MTNEATLAKRALLQSINSVAVTCLLLVTALSATACGEDASAVAEKGSGFPATVVLGLPDTRPNTSGSLTVEGGLLRFESSKQGIRAIPLSSIQEILLSQQDKQMGGTPMKLGKAAAPYGGGRVVSLFAHKKYDEVSLVYRDEGGGIHGVLFEVPEGQGVKIRDALVNNGARATPQENNGSEHAKSEVRDASVQPVTADQKSGSSIPAHGNWNVKVEELDSSGVNLDPAFRVAIYEELLAGLEKTNKFEHVYRSGDRQAETKDNLLILKMSVREFEAGSETKRAVTTVAGATKIKVQYQIQTRDRRVVKDGLADANVHFFGNNMKATHKLANKVADVIKNSKLAEPAASAPQVASK